MENLPNRTIQQPALDCLKSCVLPQCKKQRHNGITLFPSLPLSDVLCRAQFVFPDKWTGSRKKHRTKERTWSPSSILLRPRNIEFLEMRS